MLLSYMGEVTSPGEFCLLPEVVISDPHGNGEKLKNPKGVVGVCVLDTLFVSWVSDSQLSSCPMKLKFGDITERRFLTYS